MPTRPFFRPPLQPDWDAIARRNKMLADTHEIIRQTTQSIEQVRELLHRIELVVRRRLGTLRRMAKIRSPARRVRGP